MVSVHDLKAQSRHELYIYRLDYRPRSAPSVGNVVAFSEPGFAAWRTEQLKLGTPAHYRDEKKHAPMSSEASRRRCATAPATWGR